jgi:putative PEP-CTERM system histidine kinase
MNALAPTSYGLAALSFLLLTILLSTSWRGGRLAAHLAAASAATVLWALVLSLQHYFVHMPVLAIYLAEVARDCAWMLALATLAGPAAPRWLVFGVRGLCLLLITTAIATPALESLGRLAVDPTAILSRTGLAASLVALILLEQIHRNSTAAARSSLKFFTIGVGALFAYDLFLYSQAELFRAISIDAWGARGILSALAVPLIAIAARRNPDWALDIFVSRQIVFYTATFIAAGAYLIAVAIGGYYVREMGGAWGRVGQILFFAGAGVMLAGLLASSTLRRHAQVFINKHFYRNKYDYRIEWLRFISTLSAAGQHDVRQTSLRAMTQIVASPGGVLFLLDEDGQRFVPHAGWSTPSDEIVQLKSLSVSEDLPQFLSRKQWIIDTDEFRRAPDMYENVRLPEWLLANETLRIVSPLLRLERLVGFVVLYEPPPPFTLTYEDRDLLKTVGRHVATHIAQHDADRKLAESRQFEAYNRLTAFMMHDLKNSAAQLQLIVENSARHKRNPEFVDDAIGTIANTVERMTRLIEQLRGSATPDRLSVMDLAALASEAVARCSARPPRPTFAAASAARVEVDPDRLTAVIEHVIRNAQDATSESGAVAVTVDASSTHAFLRVADSGVGMDPDFLRDRLFRPFDSTKGARGMGIGAYQVREYVRSLGGNVEVQSSPGQGTCFTISLPACERLRADGAAKPVLAAQA